MSSMLDPEMLENLSTAAERLGVTPPVLSNWKSRYPDFPAPVLTLGKNLIFDRSAIDAFCLRNDLPRKVMSHTIKTDWGALKLSFNEGTTTEQRNVLVEEVTDAYGLEDN